MDERNSSVKAMCVNHEREIAIQMADLLIVANASD